MAEGGSAGGAHLYSDTVYARRAWTAPPEAAYPPQEYIGPFASTQERLVSQSLASLRMSGAELQEYVRPPLPQVQLFPARYGYSETEIGIEDLINLPRRGESQQRVESDFSQTPNSTQSTSRNTLGQV
jgi:hypothetical protein